MYLFRISTWHSLAVHALLLLIIAAAIALPIERDTAEPREDQRIAARAESTESSNRNTAVPTSEHRNFVQIMPNPSSESQATTKRRQRATGPREKTKTRDREAKTTPKDYVLSVRVGGHAERYKGQREDVWVLAFIPDETLKEKRTIQVLGYRTIRDTAPQSDFRWTRQVHTQNKKSVYGALVTVSPQHPHYDIATLKMSEETKANLTIDMREDVDEYRIDKLPSALSIYQFAVRVRHQLAKPKYRDIVDVQSFDISKSSEFGQAFKEMVKEKGTGAGDALSEEEDKWEWELYERIESGAVVLEDSLKLYNRDILEEFWDEADPVLQYIGDQDIWDKERRERLALGESFQAPGKN
ncbi:hypothetical protein F5878DRAFT_643752 [Lentinula raphanica]|uniref:Uncharacterized protein n=1 Tax=Lentinula raphanica TaxID=153919 RepID=A0AA38P4L2_9AGAR|nr:hypothetical protein F5878DRAFT_643752 [Lentinula raphanica]